jgi:WD40 repeat protein
MDYLIVAGSYERLLYGLTGIAPEGPSYPALHPEFIYPAHISCIKALSANQRFLATGSTDEHVKIYDLKIKKEVGTLMHHTGSITCLAFHKRSHLMTASEDGQIAIVRTSDWEVLKTLTGHKHAVNDLSIHPSGKVMLSVGRDGTLKCWDLGRGLCAYSMKLPQRGEKVRWSPDGDYYAVLMDRQVQIYQVSNGEVIGTIQGSSRINAIAFTSVQQSTADGNNDGMIQVVVTGEENQKVTLWSPEAKELVSWNTKDESRVKDLAALATSETQTLLTTVSSTGRLKVWDLSQMLSGSSTLPVAQYDAKCRLTCVMMAPSMIPVAKPEEEEADKAKDGYASAYESCLSEYEEEKAKPVVKVILEGEKTKSAAAAAAAKKKRTTSFLEKKRAKKAKVTVKTDEEPAATAESTEA